jgi:hypothetical protein
VVVFLKKLSDKKLKSFGLPAGSTHYKEADHDAIVRKIRKALANQAREYWAQHAKKYVVDPNEPIERHPQYLRDYYATFEYYPGFGYITKYDRYAFHDRRRCQPVISGNLVGQEGASDGNTDHSNYPGSRLATDPGLTYVPGLGYRTKCEGDVLDDRQRVPPFNGAALHEPLFGESGAKDDHTGDSIHPGSNLSTNQGGASVDSKPPACVTLSRTRPSTNAQSTPVDGVTTNSRVSNG